MRPSVNVRKRGSPRDTVIVEFGSHVASNPADPAGVVAYADGLISITADYRGGAVTVDVSRCSERVVVRHAAGEEIASENERLTRLCATLNEALASRDAELRAERAKTASVVKERVYMRDACRIAASMLWASESEGDPDLPAAKRNAVLRVVRDALAVDRDGMLAARELPVVDVVREARGTRYELVLTSAPDGRRMLAWLNAPGGGRSMRLGADEDVHEAGYIAEKMGLDYDRRIVDISVIVRWLADHGVRVGRL